VERPWECFSSGKNNSLRSDIFFPAEKHTHTLSIRLCKYLPKVGFFFAISLLSVVRGPEYFSRRKLMSERSELPFPRAKYPGPLAAPKPGRLRRESNSELKEP
jgi:hypothetical protein